MSVQNLSFANDKIRLRYGTVLETLWHWHLELKTHKHSLSPFTWILALIFRPFLAILDPLLVHENLVVLHVSWNIFLTLPLRSHGSEVGTSPGESEHSPKSRLLYLWPLIPVCRPLEKCLQRIWNFHNERAGLRSSEVFVLLVSTYFGGWLPTVGICFICS